MSHVHSPVFLNEVIDFLINDKTENFLDCTLGEGGHSEEILKKFGGVFICGLDRDLEILEIAKKRLFAFQDRFIGLNMNFREVSLEKINDLGGKLFDSALIDLGISQFHYKLSGRGFSFSQKERLDMRLDNESLDVYEIINNYSEESLSDIFFKYGEERFARRIAKNIVSERNHNEIKYSDQLAEIIAEAIPRKFWPNKIHPATKSFQALRIFANNEFENIEKGIPAVLKVLKKGGRLGVITFHSIEDRIVKRLFTDLNKDCICPPQAPICTCNKIPEVNWIAKVIKPSDNEILENPSSRSAKLRVVEKI